MSHLTQEEIQALADEVGDLANRQRFLDHAATCSRCGKELELHQALSRAIRKIPVHKTSRQFTSRIMARIDPKARQGVLFGFFGGAGRMLAMAVVLAAVLYAMTLSVPGTTAADGAVSSELFQQLSSTYGSVKAFMTDQSSRMQQTVDRRASGQGIQILAMTLIVLIVLGLLDRYVLRHFVRMKL